MRQGDEAISALSVALSNRSFEAIWFTILIPLIG
jgi:hypothetical protein